MEVVRTEGAFRSRFGGLWIDRWDAEEILEDRVRRGRIGGELAKRIGSFLRDGYVVIPEAVPTSLTMAIRDELDRYWADPPSGALIEARKGMKRALMTPEAKLRNRSHKLLDVHAHSALVRQAAAAPAVVEFLQAIFDARPKAFQTLTFWRGSQQAIHKDTAYVRIASEPMHLAASWIALEDVARGSGELKYYVGSHRDPEFLFGGQHKWMVEAPREHPEYLASLRLDARRYKHPRRTFLAKEGDALIWHADLAHGGSRIWRRGSTRQSLVTHYTPAHDSPPYALERQQSPLDEHGCLFLSEHHEF
jgi:ectoine hydroxylase-related dioxygenase (phytanoyl-CoA dioxygenase family)